MADSLGIKCIDFDGWFVQMKKTSQHVLFPRLGTHWNKYGSVLATDSLIKYLEGVRHIDLPNIAITGIDNSTHPVENENDIGEGLNLIFPFRQGQYEHPQYHYTSDTAHGQIKTIFIGDSFLWSFMNNDLPGKLGNGWEVWFYFNEIWSERPEQEYIGHYDWMKKINESDCIIIMNTSINMHSIGTGFAQRAYKKFYGNKK